MKITETINRDCCQPNDLKLVEGSKLKFCMHCGAYHERTTDNEGDSVYQKITKDTPESELLVNFVKTVAALKLCQDDESKCVKMANGQCLTHDYSLRPVITEARKFLL